MHKPDNSPPFSVGKLQTALSPLFTSSEIKLIVLFGSYAKKTVHKKSDLDLAFLYDEVINIIDLTNEISQLLHTSNIDIIDIRKAKPLLKHSIMKHGIIIYEREPGIFNETASLAFRRYVDTGKLRVAQDRYIRNYIAEQESR
ncbi:MAG: nucleotidyltransferase domain-containing protein [Nitrospira sp.]|nr:nucleotidyltransferase domain-containing protein [bacterium]MBL7049549.1 nucleotidyltransferase domain-containing protein [Nitrospira sp.]